MSNRKLIITAMNTTEERTSNEFNGFALTKAISHKMKSNAQKEQSNKEPRGSGN